MRNLLALLAFALLAFGGIGWYLNWYTVSSAKSASGGKSFNIDFDSNKITEDVNKVREGIENTKQRLAEVPANKETPVGDNKVADSTPE